ncbi:MAG TPA: tail fiber domain-containing protein, partial [Chitinophagales bacterium]|nr:tail fiber domain-containing protein [Chitinophagales bacterium]
VKQCQELHYSTDKFLPFSDKRLKKNIVSVNNVLANFDKLNVYSYEYQAPAGYTGFLPNGKHFGFMAQELKDVYPNFVQLNSNGYYSVNYQEMIPLLAKGMQEQQTQIEELKKEVAELKSLVKSQQSVAMK